MVVRIYSFLIFFEIFHFMCMDNLPARMSLLHVCLGTMGVPGMCWKPEEGMGSLGAAVTDG